MNDPASLHRDLDRLIRRLVERPEAVHVGVFRERGATFFKVRVAQEDLGKVIGRQGRTARALRALLETRGDRDGRKYGLDIRES